MTIVIHVVVARVKTKVVTALTVHTRPTTPKLLTTPPVPTRHALPVRELRQTRRCGMQVEQIVWTVRLGLIHRKELVNAPTLMNVHKTHVKTMLRAPTGWVRIIVPVSLVTLAKTVRCAPRSTTIPTVVTYAATLAQCALRVILEKGKRHRALRRQTVFVLKTIVLVPTVLLQPVKRVPHTTPIFVRLVLLGFTSMVTPVQNAPLVDWVNINLEQHAMAMELTIPKHALLVRTGIRLTCV